VKPVLFVTNHAPAHRVPAFARLAGREGVEFALVGGRLRHGGGGSAPAGIGTHVAEREVYGLARSGRFRAVIAGISGRVALPAAHLGARRARIPFVLWATLWAHPRTPVHALSYLPLRHLYRDADALVTYGPHVSRYVRAKGARSPVFEAPQAVDAAFWGAAGEPDRRAPFQAVFVGRMEAEKGVPVLLEAWRRAAAGAPGDAARLVLAGDGPLREDGAAVGGAGVESVGRLAPVEVRNLLGGSDVLVLPSIPRPDFLEPWGLVANEAMHQGLPVIATDAVGAAAGGLVEDGRTGLVVPAGDPGALAAALARLRDDALLRDALGRAARERVQGYSFAAWTDGMVRGLAAVGAARTRAERALA